jgi:3-oxoacyl-[acyl-carrier protein] reductase
VLAQRRVEPLQSARSQLKHAEVFHVPTDLSDRKAVDRLVKSVLDRFGQVNILVNDASLSGTRAIAPVLNCPPEMVDEIVDVNLKGTFYCSQSVAKAMVTAGHGGNIVHVASVGAYASQEFASLYCVTKAAQVALARGMALELAIYGIRVNCIAPGDIFTEASANIVTDVSAVGGTGNYLRKTPLGQRGTAEEIGHAVAYLVSDEAAFVTGTTLVVDGSFLSY